MQFTSGYTVLEFIITLGILGVLLNIGLMSLSGAAATGGARSCATEVLAFLDSQAQASSSLGRNISITYKPASHAFEGRSFDTEADLPYKDYFWLPKTTAVRDFRFGRTGKDFSRLNFYAKGPATPGRIVLEDNSGLSCSIVQALRGARHIKCLP